MGKFEIIIASDSDRNNVFAELWFDENMLAEVSHEAEEVEIRFFCDKKSMFNLDDFIEALKTARSAIARV